MTTVVDILKKGKALIADASNWTRGALARRSDGSVTDCLDPDATQFCSIGAICRTDQTGNAVLAQGCLEKITFSCFGRNLIDINDRLCSHEQVMKVWDEAIKMAEREEIRAILLSKNNDC